MKIVKLSRWAQENDYSYRDVYNKFLHGSLPQGYRTETGRIVAQS